MNEELLTQKDTSAENEESAVKTAVVYFSAAGNTKEIAQMISEELDAELFEIIPAQVYTDEHLNYNDDSCRVDKEQEDESSRPEIKNDLDAASEYDVIYLGYPIWRGKGSPHHTDISGKL